MTAAAVLIQGNCKKIYIFLKITTTRGSDLNKIGAAFAVTQKIGNLKCNLRCELKFEYLMQPWDGN